MSLPELFVDELRSLYDAEKQLGEALSQMATAAVSNALRNTLRSYCEQTREHAERLGTIMDDLGETVTGHHCSGMAAVLDKSQSILIRGLDETIRDACLIAVCRRAEHYEIAAYGTLVTWAEILDNPEVARLLEEILGEEETADETLASLEEVRINQRVTNFCAWVRESK